MMINSHLKRQWFGKPTYKKDGWTSRVYTLHDLRFSSIGTWVWTDEMHLTKDPVEQSAPKSTPIHTASPQETKDSTDESEAKKKVETETWCCFKTMSRCTHLPEISVIVFLLLHIFCYTACGENDDNDDDDLFGGSCYWLTSLNFGLIGLALTKATQECFAMGGDSDSVPWFGWSENPIRWCWMWSVKKGFQWLSRVCCQLDTLRPFRLSTPRHLWSCIETWSRVQCSHDGCFLFTTWVGFRNLEHEQAGRRSNLTFQ